jgi:hypothetical protein
MKPVRAERQAVQPLFAETKGVAEMIYAIKDVVINREMIPEY